MLLRAAEFCTVAILDDFWKVVDFVKGSMPDDFISESPGRLVSTPFMGVVDLSNRTEGDAW